MAARLVTCPTCKRKVAWSAESPFRPFCSERCRLIDLGAWASEQHSIAGDEGIGTESDGDLTPSAGPDDERNPRH